MAWIFSATRTRGRALLAAVLVLCCSMVQAGPVWQQTDALASALDNSGVYTTNGNAGIITFTNQIATNTGSTSQHMGMYFGWNWITGYTGGDVALPWSNANGAFQGGPVSLTIERIGFGAQTLRIGDVVGDTWVGNPWAPAGVSPAIATAADWEVPLFDFGVMQAGGSISYDIRLTYDFATATDLANFQYFNAWAQGVQQIPEPGSLALAGLALLCAGAVRARKPRG